jgi:hypothetical protein
MRAVTKEKPINASAGILIFSRAGSLSHVCSGICYLSEYVAVAMAVTRKVITAKNDRNENLGIPHNPCPLVHPLASSVPSPTKNPATAKCVMEEESVYVGLSKGRFIVL